MRRVLGVIVVALCLPLGAVASASEAPGTAATGPNTKADFNGDGFADLAVGVPQEDIGSIPYAGAVNVLYGSSTGLRASGSQFWHQDVTGVAGDGAEDSDFFGAALATGDFNGDGFADLAVGVPREYLGSTVQAGAVNVLYGSPTGLTSFGDQFLTQDTEGVSGDGAEESDQFGFALVAADFGNGPQTDLAVGVPGEDVGTTTDAGAVNVLYGSPTGLTGEASQFWHQDISDMAGDGAEQDDSFGRVLAAGDLGYGSTADLAVGVPFEDVGTTTNAGAVNVLYSSSIGLTSGASHFWTQESPGVAGDKAQVGDIFGGALAVGNFGKGSLEDLAVGVPQEDLGARLNAGAVNVLYGASAGLTATGSQFWHQNKSGVAGDGAQQGDNFGGAVAAGNFGKGSQSDLAVGAPGEGVGAAALAGAVNVLYGGSGGLTTTGSQFWHQDKARVAGDGAEFNDQFGSALAVGNFGKTSSSDLAVGAIPESIGNKTGAGAVNVLYSASSGITADGSQFWHQDKTGVAGDGAEAGDFFGRVGAAFIIDFGG